MGGRHRGSAAPPLTWATRAITTAPRTIARYARVVTKVLQHPHQPIMMQHWRMLVSEAIRDANRDFLRRAETIAVLLDERNCWLLIKFQGCNAKLSVRFGVLGLLFNAGTTAQHIAAAVYKAVRDIWTRRRRHPSCNKVRSDVASVVDDS